MIDRELARKQIARIAQMKGFPRDFPEAIGELIDALTGAENEEIAKVAIGSFIETATADTPCPFPYDIRVRLLAKANKILGEMRPDPDCDKCGGTGEAVIRNIASPYFDKSMKCDCYARRPAPVWKKSA